MYAAMMPGSASSMISNRDISEANRLASDLSGLNFEPQDAAALYVLFSSSLFSFFFLFFQMFIIFSFVQLVVKNIILAGG
jgi:hypothetical protein